EEHDAGVDGRQVDAAVAAGRTEHVVPVGAVEREPRGEVLDPGDVPELESLRAAPARDTVLRVPALFDIRPASLVVRRELLARLAGCLEPLHGGARLRVEARARPALRAARDRRVLLRVHRRGDVLALQAEVSERCGEILLGVAET